MSVSFEYGPTTAYGSSTPIQVLTATDAFQASISGLTPGIIYHFRAKAKSEIPGTTYGIDLTFSTSIKPPEVTTSEPTAINYTGATLNGDLDSSGTAPSVNVYFEYGRPQAMA